MYIGRVYIRGIRILFFSEKRMVFLTTAAESVRVRK